LDVNPTSIYALCRRFVPVLKGLGLALLCAGLVLTPVACDRADSELTVSSYLPRTAHQAYGHALAQTSLAQTALGRDWLAAAERALAEPQPVFTPFESTGSFEVGKAAALGYSFSVEAGQRVAIQVIVHSVEPLEAFIDVFRVSGRDRTHIASAAPMSAGGTPDAERRIELEVFEAGEYVLRVQPELLRGGDYEVGIRSEPVLAFPVSGHDSRAIQSGFGAERDAGARAHRGVDIFAARGTLALAATDAWVSRVDTTRRGGNVVWLQPLFGNMRLYYAHLDTQSVERGQFVQAGDIVGTVGNTGNAITTPPHLHFGVYLRRRGRRGGARDPYDFLN